MSTLPKHLPAGLPAPHNDSFRPSPLPGNGNVDDEPELENDSDKAGDSKEPKKRTARACIRCRFRHTRCPGGQPCLKCQMAKTKCEYVEYEKRLVVSRKYLYKLQEDIARLKKENAALRNTIKETPRKAESEAASVQHLVSQLSDPGTGQFGGNFGSNYNQPQHIAEIKEEDTDADRGHGGTEVINPSLDKYGRLIQSRTGEKLYVGSSSMTLFGLEIQNMAPSFEPPSLLHPNSISTTPVDSPQSNFVSQSSFQDTATSEVRRQTKILEKEGNAYNITLAKTNTRPGLSVNFTLPSYSYAILLVDTFISYNDGCFYFFNEGLVKRFLMNLYLGNTRENKRIIKRNIAPREGPAEDENTIKKDTDNETILETIWFCKILLIFAVGEMYLGTDSDTHMERSKQERISMFGQKKSKKKDPSKRNTLPGSGFFYQASELFTGLFASGAIDNITKDGGIEVILLYAFYLQVADCTIASYFYFGLALRSTLILGWHVDADSENLNRFELEHRRRIWWTVYMYERMLSSKAGLPLSFADDSVSTELPYDFKIDLDDFPRDENDVRGYYIFPSAEYINNCVTITQINAIILSSLYTKQPTANILPVVSDLVQRLLNWKLALPDFLQVDFSKDDVKITRLIVNLMTEYFQGMNLAVRPLLFHFATKKLRELQVQNSSNKYVDLTKYSKNVLTLLNASFQASINTIKSIWALMPQNMVALFGWMDREYLFTSASTLILFNASFGVHDATREHLDHALTLFTKMKKLGNYPAALRRAQLLKLIRVLDFNGVMQDLLNKHDYRQLAGSMDGDVNMDSENNAFGDTMSFINLGNAAAVHMNPQNVVKPQPGTQAPEPLRASLDYLQFNGPNPSSGLAASHRHTPTIPASANLTTEAAFDFKEQNANNADFYSNADLAGIEGLTYIDEEQKLWNEITNEAVWLQSSSGIQGHAPKVDHSSVTVNDDFVNTFNSRTLQKDMDTDINHDNHTTGNGNPYAGGYGDIINLEFLRDLF